MTVVQLNSSKSNVYSLFLKAAQRSPDRTRQSSSFGCWMIPSGSTLGAGNLDSLVCSFEQTATVTFMSSVRSYAGSSLFRLVLLLLISLGADAQYTRKAPYVYTRSIAVPATSKTTSLLCTVG